MLFRAAVASSEDCELLSYELFVKPEMAVLVGVGCVLGW